MSKWYAKLIYSSGEEDMVNDGEPFDSEQDARDAALYEIGCYQLGGDILHNMGGEEDEIDDSTPDYEVWREDD